MKQGIHPDHHEITVQLTNGEKFTTRSTWGKKGDTLQLDVDPKTHPAWVGGQHLKKTGQMEKFQNRFANFDFASTKKAAAEPAAKKEPKADKKDAKKADDAASAE